MNTQSHEQFNLSESFYHSFQNKWPKHDTKLVINNITKTNYSICIE